MGEGQVNATQQGYINSEYVPKVPWADYDNFILSEFNLRKSIDIQTFMSLRQPGVAGAVFVVVVLNIE